ncbi:MAG TPA: glycosyltransferase family 87 protein [Candidatus Binatia bacterium]|nr:glycosyltransferase family 87 protein [Candidatus Binatia bacterium]
MSSSPRNRRRRPRGALAAVVAFFAVAGAIAYRVVEGTRVPGNPSFPRWAFCDFRTVVYYPGVSFLAGGNPYDAPAFTRMYPVPVNFPLYSPLVILMHLPFALLPITASAIAYFLTILGLTLLVALMALRFAGCTPTVARIFGTGALLLLSRPGQANLTLGQVAATATAACYAALWWSRSRPWLAAAGLAVATFKPTFGGPLVLLLLARGDWGAVARGLAIAAVATAGPALTVVARAGGPLAMLHLITSAQGTWSALPENAASASIIRLDVGALVGRLLGRSPSAPALIALAVALLATAGLAIRRLDPREADAWRLSAALACVAILLSGYHQAYDALLLALPATALVAGRWAPAAVATRGARGFLLAALTIPAVNYVGTYALLPRLPASHGFWVVATSANGAALLGAFVAYAWVALRVPVGQPGSAR